MIPTPTPTDPSMLTILFLHSPSEWTKIATCLHCIMVSLDGQAGVRSHSLLSAPRPPPSSDSTVFCAAG